jgi:hypothetical protein
MNNSIVASARHLNAPWIAAHLAVLNEGAAEVRLDVDFESLAAKWTCHQELVCHCRQSYCNASQSAMHMHVSYPSRVPGEVPLFLVPAVRVGGSGVRW